MPNRIIKESICSSEDIESLTAEEEIFYYRLWVNCDDYGRFDARQLMLKSKLYPLKKHVQSDDIKPYLDSLLQKGLIELYGVKGILYGQVMAWDKHQQIRAKRSKYPSKSESDYTCNQMISDDGICHRNPIQSNPIQSESKSESEDKTPLPKCPDKCPSKKERELFFESIWGLYPKKEGKGQVSDAQKNKLYLIGIEEVTRAINRYIEAKKGTEKQFLKQGSTFFNSGYIDYLDENYQTDQIKPTGQEETAPEWYNKEISESEEE